MNSRFVVHLEVSSSSRVTTRTVCTCLAEGKLQTVFCAEKSCGSIPAGCCLTSSSHQGWANLPCKMNPALLSLGPLFITQQQMAKRAHVRSLAHIQRHSHCRPLRSKPRLHSQLFSIFPLPLFYSSIASLLTSQQCKLQSGCYLEAEITRAELFIFLPSIKKHILQALLPPRTWMRHPCDVRCLANLQVFSKRRTSSLKMCLEYVFRADLKYLLSAVATQ